MEYQDGTIIEFSDDRGRHLLAAIQRDEGKQKRLRILAEGGRELSITPKQITLSLSQLAPLSKGQAAVLDTLAVLRATAEAAAAKATPDLPLLWELSLELAASQPQRALPLDTLSDLQFSSTSPTDQWATLLLLRADALYFKQRLPNFEPRTPEQVEALRHEQQVARDRANARDLFRAEVLRIAALPPPERPAATKALSGHLILQNLFQRLTRYVLEGDDFKDHADTDALIEWIETDLPPPALEGRQSLRAFDLLVRLGHWDRHENLTLLRARIPTDFADDAVSQSSRLISARPETQGRADLTKLVTFSIDDPETQDIDDALSIEWLSGNRIRVGIHIADPSHYVELDSPLEREARRRGSTVYMPTGRIPMFPTELSEGLFSLQQGELRPTVSFIVDFDAAMSDAEPLSFRITPSVIRVTHRLDYDQADALMREPDGDLQNMLRQLHLIGEHLAAKRLDQGAYQVNLPDVKIKVDGDHIKVVQIAANAPSRDLVAEMMVLANTLAARFCRENDIPVPFRAQEPPEVQPYSPEIMAYPEGLPRAFAMMRHMRSASTTTEPRPHAGLGVSAYTQATSPIRRYVDYLTHLQILSFLADGRPLLDARQAGERSAFAEGNASDARAVSRSSDRYWLMRYLEANAGELQVATVLAYVDSHSDKANVVLNKTMIRGSVSTRKRLPLGTEIMVQVTRCYPRADILNLRMVEGDGSESESAPE